MIMILLRVSTNAIYSELTIHFRLSLGPSHTRISDFDDLNISDEIEITIFQATFPWIKLSL